MREKATLQLHSLYNAYAAARIRPFGNDCVCVCSREGGEKEMKKKALAAVTKVGALTFVRQVRPERRKREMRKTINAVEAKYLRRGSNKRAANATLLPLQRGSGPI